MGLPSHACARLIEAGPIASRPCSLRPRDSQTLGAVSGLRDRSANIHGHAVISYLVAVVAMLFNAASYGKMSGGFRRPARPTLTHNARSTHTSASSPDGP
jgi:hypothetical protein